MGKSAQGVVHVKRKAKDGEKGADGYSLELIIDGGSTFNFKTGSNGQLVSSGQTRSYRVLLGEADVTGSCAISPSFPDGCNFSEEGLSLFYSHNYYMTVSNLGIATVNTTFPDKSVANVSVSSAYFVLTVQYGELIKNFTINISVDVSVMVTKAYSDGKGYHIEVNDKFDKLGKTGIDIENKKITLKADNIEFLNNAGDTMAIFVDDHLNADLIDAKQIVTDGLQAQTIDAKNATITNLNVEKCKITGSTRIPFTMASNAMDLDYSDNVALISNNYGWSVEGGTEFNIKWDVGQSGRRVTLVNYKWEDKTADGYGVIVAPNGQYFYEDGIAKTGLKISRQVVELLGYGTETTFYGWIVLSRIDIQTNSQYGHSSHVLAYATITGSKVNANDSKVSISQITYDGRDMTIECLDTGKYELTLPSAWFQGAAGDAIVTIVPRASVFVYITSKSGNKITFYCKQVSSTSNFVDTKFDIAISNARDLNFLMNSTSGL